jgi:hypothetical protein
VEHVIDLALELLQVGCGDSQVRLLEVAFHGDHLLLVGPPALARRRELLFGALANEHVDRAPAPQQIGDEVSADETGRTGDEVGHLDLLAVGGGQPNGCRARIDCIDALPARSRAIVTRGSRAATRAPLDGLL